MGQNQGVHQEDSEFAGFYLLSHIQKQTPSLLSLAHTQRLKLEVLAGQLCLIWEEFCQVKMENVQKSAEGMRGHCKLSCVSLGRMRSFKRGWCQQSNSRKTTRQRAPLWSPRGEKCVQLLIDWVGPVVTLPTDGISSIHTCDRCRKMRGSLKTWFWSFAGTPRSRFKARHPSEW